MNSLDNSTGIDSMNSQVKQLAEEYPYYAMAQFDLLRSFNNNRSPAFHQQAGKTALFFSNTYWLSWQLHPQKAISNEEIIINPIEEDNVNDTHSPIIDTPAEPPQDVPITDLEPFADVRVEESTYQQDPVGTDIYLEPELHEPEIIKEEIKELENVENEISFEPLHTVDYFASQGIKITEEPIANDKLGKQMKSFTEWLKSMKKVHAGKSLPDDQADRRIQTIADESNSITGVVTEAMAEVLAQQGSFEKSREMFRKLSLINPSKSAYFAAKIDSLKEN